MTHWHSLNIFPDEMIALNAELVHHPVLQERLANHPSQEWEIKLAEIAHYCDLILDGDYLPEDILRICKILKDRLEKKRERLGGLVMIESSGL